MSKNMDFDTTVKQAVYLHFADTGKAPSVSTVATVVNATEEEVHSSYARLADVRALVLEAEGTSIRMALPFSGVPTQHIVESEGIQYYANCAWDALGIPAALGRPATVRSSCAQSGDPLVLEIPGQEPPPSDWLFHCLVPAASWWDDIVFT
ncbi:MAG: organomercurial lyase [Longimicrobiales bacterium]